MLVGRPWQQWTVGVTGMNAIPDNPGPGMAVARCLEDSDLFHGRVVGFGYDVLDAGLYGSTRSGYLLPYPSCPQRVLLERIQDIHAREGLNAIIPCLDSELPNFVALRPQLAQAGIAVLLPSQNSLRMRNKQDLASLCQRLGLNHPRTKTVTDPRFFEECWSSGEWTYPLVVKGPFYGAKVASTPAQAKLFFAETVKEWGYPVLVQEFVAGHEVNLTGVGDGQGRLLGEVAMRKQAVTDKGKAWAGVTITDPELSLLAHTLVEALDWEGPLEVEALRTTDGELTLVEINPRFPAWVYLSTAVGRNLPVSALALMAGQSELSFPPPRAGTMFLRYAQDVIADISQLEQLISIGSLDSAPLRRIS